MGNRLFPALALAATVAALSACASLPAPVPLVADPEGLVLLQGEWAGEYSSPRAGRSGSITFMLETHGDSTICRGDVMMIPLGFSEPVMSTEGWSVPGRPDEPPSPTVLRIQSLRVTGNKLSGVIEPYRDPYNGTAVSTTFEGTIRGDKITGDLVSIDAGSGDRVTGVWSATRRSRT